MNEPISGASIKFGDAAGIKSSSPSPGDLALINQLALKPLVEKDVACFTARVSNDQVDRDNERFSLQCLHDFAASMPGKGLLEGHNWGPVGIGLFYKAWVEEDPTTHVNWLMGKFYLLTSDTEAAQMIARINGGVAKYISIGFFAPARYAVTAADGTEFVELDRDPEGRRCEALEASLVWLGSQHDAAVISTDTVKALRMRRGDAQKNAWARSLLMPWASR